MGLDMMVFKTREAIGKPVDFYPPDDVVWDDVGEGEEAFHWRRFNNLHGWMRDLYYSKGGVGIDAFNGERVQLTKEDLERLAIDAPDLKPMSGFFWGGLNPMTDEKINEVHDFVAKAMELLDEGYNLYYVASW